MPQKRFKDPDRRRAKPAPFIFHIEREGDKIPGVVYDLQADYGKDVVIVAYNDGEVTCFLEEDE